MSATTGVNGPMARRLRLPSWRDPKLVVGLVLVLGSVGAGARVVAAADRTVPVYVARATLPPGAALEAADLGVARLRLTGAGASYLDGARPVPAGMVLGRTVGAGELVPQAALVPAAALAARPVSVPMPAGIPAGLVAGGRADLWGPPAVTGRAGTSGTAGTTGTSRNSSRGTVPAQPRLIAAGLEVHHVETAARDGLGSARTPAVQLLVPEATLPVVLAALGADESTLQVLPVPG